MYIESVPNRGSPPAILLRESFRADGRVRKRTLANLSAWPTALVEGFRTLLRGGVAVAADGIGIRRALPHGHAVAVLGTLRAIGLDRLLGKPADKRLAPLAMALIASRLIAPASKLATARELAVATAGSSLGRLLRLGAVDEVELYRALDWLGARQSAIETALAHRHLTPLNQSNPTTFRPATSAIKRIVAPVATPNSRNAPEPRPAACRAISCR